MAHSGNGARNSHLQVGSRIKLAFIAALLISSLSAAPALAESPKPSPKVTAKATTKATTKATAKATATAKPTATAKATPKPTATKKRVVKKRKKILVSPSPKAVWPPNGFTVEGDVYARVPTSKELVGILSAQKGLAIQIKECTTFICGAVQVASASGCTWWEVKSSILSGANEKLGDLTTAHGSSKAREIKTILTVSPESNNVGGQAKILSVICHREMRETTTATVTYEKVVIG